MSDKPRRGDGREVKYASTTKPPKPSKHGKPPQKPERPERWQ